MTLFEVMFHQNVPRRRLYHRLQVRECVEGIFTSVLADWARQSTVKQVSENEFK
jgi:hypothetical protein